ncbi:MAG: DUF4347 domain-containing protein [Deltaproteobacteria bacterium]|nr:DUF4347 domain-containing protein [Deltaproteobacteria bacterium]
MNRIYRSVWSRIHRTVTAVTEAVQRGGTAHSSLSGTEEILAGAAVSGNSLLSYSAYKTTQRRKFRIRNIRPLALEPRLMFDGAAAVDAAHASPDVPTKSLLPDSPAALEVRAPDPAKDEGRREIAIMDTSVRDFKVIEAGIRAGIGILEIDGTKDGLAQIAKWAESAQGYDAIHIFSHGAEGQLVLGANTITSASLQSEVVQAQLGLIGQALNRGSDLLLYGCNIGNGQNGEQFVADLATATGVDVAASNDPTGDAVLGGDWSLEIKTGAIDSDSLNIPGYASLLAQPVSGTTTFGTGTYFSPTVDASGGYTVSNIVNSGWNFTVKATSNPVDVTVNVEAFTGQTMLAYGATNSGATHIAYIALASNDGKLFDLNSIDVTVDGVNSQTSGTYSIQLVGYRSGSAVSGATLTVPVMCASGGGTLVTFDVSGNSAFRGVDSFRVTPTGGDYIDGAIGVDNVNATNFHDPGPVFTSGATASFAENGSGTVYDANATGTGTITYAISGSDAGRFAINTSTGVVTFNSAPDFESPADSDTNNIYDITVTATDSNGSTAKNVAITVTNVNEAPVVTSAASSSVAENVTGTIYTATAVDPDSGQTITWSLSGTDAGLFSINSSTGAVSFNAAPNYELPADSGGNNIYDFTVIATDNGTGNLTGSRSVAITVTNINEAPINTKPGIQTGLEDTPLVFSSGNGNALSVTDQDAATILTTVVSVANGTGVLSVATGGGASITGDGSNSVQIVGSVAQVQAALSSVTYTPTSDANGSGYATLTLTSTDNGAGTLSDTDTVTIDITAINDVPGFNKGGDQVVNEDAGAQTVSGWATALSKGPANESSQTINFVVTNDNNGLFSVQPAVDASGNLTYTPASNASGTALVTVAIHDSGGTANGGVDTSATQTFTITINPVNDAPTVVEPGLIPVTEDIASPITGISFADTDAGGASVAVTLSTDSGTLSASNGGGVTVSGSGTASLTLAGAISNINAFIVGNGVSFTSDANSTSSVTLTVQIDDGGNAGAGGQMTASDSTTLIVSAVNDAPTVTVPATLTAIEDVASVITGISFADVDAGSSSVSASLTVGSGTLSATSGSGVTVSGSGTASVTLAGSVANINAFIAGGNVSFTTDINATASVTLTAGINDGGNTGSGGAKTGSDTVTINITPVNDPPTIANLNGDSVSFSIGGGAITLDNSGNAIVADIDSADLNGGNVTVSIIAAGQVGEDVLGIQNQGNSLGQIGVSGLNVGYGGISIGSFIGGSGGADLVISLNGNATPTAVQSLVRALTYTDTDAGTVNTATRTVRISVNDGDGGTSSNCDVSVTLVRAPVLDLDTGAAGSGYSGSFIEDDGPIAIASTTSASDDGTFKALAITLTNRPDGAAESLSSTYGLGSKTVNGEAVTIGAYNSGTGLLTITIDDGSTSSATMQMLMESIRYDNSSYTPNTVQPRIINFAATDNDDHIGSIVSATISVAATNDPPTVTVPGSITVSEDIAGAITGIIFNDVDVGGASVTVTLSVGSGMLSSTTGGGVSVSGSNTTTLTLTGSIVDINAFIAGSNVTFTTDANATAGVTLTASMDDGGNSGAGGAKVASDNVTINVTPVNDAPTLSNLAGDSTAYLMGSGEKLIDQGAGVVITDIDSADFNGGALTVSIVGNRVPAEDVLSIRNQGTAAGQIGVLGANVTYGGVLIGTFTGGSGTNDLVVSLNANASLTAVSALARNITYQNSDNLTATESSRTVRFVVTDGDGGASPNADATVVVSRNTLPTGGDATVTMQANSSHIFTTNDFPFADADAGDSLQQVTIVSLPSAGILSLNGVDVTANQIIQVTDIAAGKFKFAPATNGSGDAYASFTFKVSDGKGTSLTAYTETFNVNAASTVTRMVDVSPNVASTVGSLLDEGSSPVLEASSLSHSAGFLPVDSPLANPSLDSLMGAPSTGAFPVIVMDHNGHLFDQGRPAFGGLTQGHGGFQIIVIGSQNESGPHGLMLNRGMPDQTIPHRGATEILIPVDVFSHTDPNAVVQLEAKQSNGRPLPGWAQFDPRIGKFVVRPPLGWSGELSIRVTAHDSHGYEAVTVFKVHVEGRGQTQTAGNAVGRAALSDQIRLVSNRPILLERFASTSRSRFIVGGLNA